VDAVACVIAVQRAMVQRNADASKDRLVQNRVGINIGDIIVELLYPADRSEH
jgi:adenylate cyclase